MINSDKLNSIIKSRANGNSAISLHLHQMFFFEHVLMRLEKSKYRDNIILKGGVLLSSIIGSDMRTTKDIDTTLKSIPLNEDSIRNIFEEILSIDIDDGLDLACARAWLDMDESVSQIDPYSIDNYENRGE